MNNIVYQKDNSVGNYTYNDQIYSPCEWGYHFHKNIEVIFVIDGMLEMQIDGKTEYLNKDQFALILPNSIHALHTPENATVWICVFSADFVTDFSSMIAEKAVTKHCFICKTEELKYLKTALLNINEKEILSLKACLYILCNRFLTQVQLINQPKSNDLAHRIITYVEQNFKQEITLFELSKIFGYEYHYFSRSFRNLFHTNFKTFLNRYRFDYAKKLLLKSDMDITEIAAESGFGSLRNFNRIYKEFSETTPSEHRKKLIFTKKEP